VNVCVCLQIVDACHCAGERLTQPSRCPDDFYQLMLRCWSIQPASRPKFSELFLATLPQVQFATIWNSLWSRVGPPCISRDRDPPMEVAILGGISQLILKCRKNLASDCISWGRDPPREVAILGSISQLILECRKCIWHQPKLICAVVMCCCAADEAGACLCDEG